MSAKSAKVYWDTAAVRGFGNGMQETCFLPVEGLVLEYWHSTTILICL